MTLEVPLCGKFEMVPLFFIILFGVVNILSVVLLVSQLFPMFRTYDLVHLNVILNEVSGSLNLGTLGYCLKVSDQNICSSHRFAYAISQFFSNHRIS